MLGIIESKRHQLASICQASHMAVPPMPQSKGLESGEVTTPPPPFPHTQTHNIVPWGLCRSCFSLEDLSLDGNCVPSPPPGTFLKFLPLLT